MPRKTFLGMPEEFWRDEEEKRTRHEKDEMERDKQLEKVKKRIARLITGGIEPEKAVKKVINDIEKEGKDYLADGSRVNQWEKNLTREAKEEKDYLNLAEKIRRIRNNPRLPEEKKIEYEEMEAKQLYNKIKADEYSLFYGDEKTLKKKAEERIKYLKPTKWGILRASTERSDKGIKGNEARKKARKLERTKRIRRR